MNEEYINLNQKKEWRAIDFWKLICAFLVVGIHYAAFSDISVELSFFVRNTVNRLAVPFFFIASGFFFESKVKSWEKVRAYIKRLFCLYLIYTIIYMPQIISEKYIENGRVFIRRFFLKGSYKQLWFFVGLITASLLLYFLVNKLKVDDGKLLLFVSCLYIIGVLGNTYTKIFSNMPMLQKILKIYFENFETTRNGLFFGLPFLSIGYLIKKYSYKIHKHSYGIWMLIFLVAMVIETEWSVKKWGMFDRDMMFCLLPAAVFLFLFVSFKNGKRNYSVMALRSRKLSTLIFGFHCFVGFYLDIVCRKIGIEHLQSLQHYIMIVILTIVLSFLIIKLSEMRRFTWLQYLY